MSADTYVSVVACVADDADIVAAFIDDATRVLAAHYTHWELIVVDDGSTDATVAVVTAMLPRYPGCRLLRLSRRFGEEIAISAGLETAIGDYVAVVAPDSDPPSHIPLMVERCRDGAGIVCGTRRNHGDDPFAARVGARAFYRIANGLFDLDIPPHATHFKVMSRQAVNAVLQVRDRNRFLRTLGARIGFAATALPYDPIARRVPPRRKTLRQSVGLAVNIIVTNTVQPLYIAARLAVLIAVLNALVLAYAVTIYLVKADVAAGWTTLSLTLATMFGALAAFAAVALWYLARLVEERSDRPLFFVLEEHGSGVPIAADERNLVAESDDRR